MNDINSFTFFEDYYNLISTLPIEDYKTLSVSILDYMFKDKKPELTGHLLAIFNTLSYQLNVSKRNAIRSKGKGAPKGNQNALKNKPKTNQKQTKNKQIYISTFLFLFSNFYISNINNKDYIYKMFEEYLEMRIKNKYTVTETVVKRLINKCNEYGKTDKEKIEIITNAINGAWKDFYPLKEHKTENKPDWYDKQIDEDTANENDIKELEARLGASRRV